MKNGNHIGTISGRDTFLNAAIGHQSHVSGTGAYKNQKRDKKNRRKQDKQATREW